MQYENVVQGRFLSRPNRFIAVVDIGGTETVCHVKNTGRCRELLVHGAAVWLAPGVTPGRKTPYDLIAVDKGGKLINMDAQAPNRSLESSPGGSIRWRRRCGRSTASARPGWTSA